MNNKEIEKHLKQCRLFKGCYPRDCLTDLDITKESCIIINTDKSSDPGEHWISLYYNGKGYGEFFDSFGFPPIQIEIIEFINRACSKLCIYWNVPLQCEKSETCGLYAIMFCKFKCKRLNYMKFFQLFTKIKCVNDKLIKKYIKKI